MKIKKLFSAVLVSQWVLTSTLCAGEIVNLTVGATANLTGVGSVTSPINTNQIVIQTNVVAQIRHLHVSTAFFRTSGGSSSGTGMLTIQLNGLSFTYDEADLNSASNSGNNMPIVVGPATISISAQASVYNAVAGQAGSALVNTLGTISLTPNQCDTSQFTPNTGVVIPSDATGPVQIILESSSDLLNWVSSLPGTYGSTYTNRFFRVRAVAH
jgi:hypothetical protein